MKTKVGIPIIIAAVVGLVIVLVIMGKTLTAGPEAVKTAPPPWIDPVTGKPKAAMQGSGKDNASGGSPSDMYRRKMGGN